MCREINTKYELVIMMMINNNNNNHICIIILPAVFWQIPHLLPPMPTHSSFGSEQRNCASVGPALAEIITLVSFFAEIVCIVVFDKNIYRGYLDNEETITLVYMVEASLRLKANSDLVLSTQRTSEPSTWKQ